MLQGVKEVRRVSKKAHNAVVSSHGYQEKGGQNRYKTGLGWAVKLPFGSPHSCKFVLGRAETMLDTHNDASPHKTTSAYTGQAVKIEDC